MTARTTKNIAKIIAAFCFLLIAVSSIIAWNSPATGFEATIFSSTPLIVWISLIICTIFGITLIVFHVYNNLQDKGNLWLIGLLLLFLSYANLLSLWIIRDYALWCRGDPIYHLGVIKNTIATGYIERDFYPVLHIYLSQISIICGLDPVLPHKYIPFLNSLLYPVFIFLLASSIFPKKGQVIITTALGMIPLVGKYITLTPGVQSILFFPLVIYLFIQALRKNQWPWRILFLLTLILLVPFHIITAISLGIVIVSIFIIKALHEFIIKRKNILSEGGTAFCLVTIVLLLILGTIWTFQFPISKNLGTSIIADDTSDNSLSMQSNTSIEKDASLKEPLAKGSYSNIARLKSIIHFGQSLGYSVSKQFVNRYGGILILLLMLLAVFIIFIKRKFKQADTIYLAWLLGPIIAFIILMITLYFTAMPFNPLRFLPYLVIFTSIFAGFFIHEILQVRGNSGHAAYYAMITPVLVILIYIVLCINGVLNVYPSRYILDINWQVTHTEITGMDWFLHNKDNSLPIKSFSISPYRYSFFLLSFDERTQSEYLAPAGLMKQAVENSQSIPAHFGYDKYASISKVFESDTYMIFTDRDYIVQDILPEVSNFKFTQDDINKLNNDNAVERLFTNGSFDLRLIHTSNPL